MSNSKKVSPAAASKQAGLFDTDRAIVEGCLDVSGPFRHELAKALRNCPESRFIVAARISELSGKELSKDMLDKATSSNLDYGLRAEQLPALCHLIGSLTPFQALLDPLGAFVVGPDEADHLHLARLIEERQERENEISRLSKKLGYRIR
jgi:hypothetical protein